MLCLWYILSSHVCQKPPNQKCCICSTAIILCNFVCFTTGLFKTNVPLKYNILLNAGSISPLIKSVGQPNFALLNGLDPYTQYEIRIQACQDGKTLSNYLLWSADSAVLQNRFCSAKQITSYFKIEVKCLPSKSKAWHWVVHFTFLHIISWIF